MITHRPRLQYCLTFVLLTMVGLPVSDAQDRPQPFPPGAIQRPNQGSLHDALAKWLPAQLKRQRLPYQPLPCPCCADDVPAESRMFPGFCHPYPQARPAAANTFQFTEGDRTLVITPESLFPEPKIDPFTKPPGTNMLPTIYTNMFDGYGREMVNTLPSTKTRPYNLHDDPEVSEINMLSPTDDLQLILSRIPAKTKGISKLLTQWGETISSDLPDPQKRGRAQAYHEELALAWGDLAAHVRFAIDILEGNPLDYSDAQLHSERKVHRAYSGFPLLHYTGPEKIQKVTPYYDASGHVIGGNVDVRQIWYDSHIESDTALLNPVDVWDVPWTITFTVDVLNRGHDDFAPFTIFTDAPSLNPKFPGVPKPRDYGNHPNTWKPWPAGPPHIGMDQTFFPMEDGTRNVFKVRMPPGKYFHLSYTWGWRMHPPRIQVVDRATKAFADPADGGKPKTLVQWETSVFTDDPRRNKKFAISQIGNLSPAKRMWNEFSKIQNSYLVAGRNNLEAAAAAPLSAEAAKALKDIVSSVIPAINQAGHGARQSFYSWKDRSRLPGYLKLDGKPIRETDFYKESDIVLLYVNNTIYGELTAGGLVRFPDWKKRTKLAKSVDQVLRTATLKVGLLNGDNFTHGYTNVDFGGMRGWENQFKPTTVTGGSGCWFTFGRANWWLNNPDVVYLPPAQKDKPSRHRVDFTYRYEPSTRLRFYQFDPLHHDVSIYSMH